MTEEVNYFFASLSLSLVTYLKWTIISISPLGWTMCIKWAVQVLRCPRKKVRLKSINQFHVSSSRIGWSKFFSLSSSSHTKFFFLSLSFSWLIMMKASLSWCTFSVLLYRIKHQLMQGISHLLSWNWEHESPSDFLFSLSILTLN